jgi:predicted DNA-binding helix-hairpin-helix protein
LEGVPAAFAMREHRLYQADWLLRVYGFSFNEVDLALGKTGNLALGKDPKFIITQAQPWLFPVDVNNASYNELLRVPGIGPTSAQRILFAHSVRSINSPEQLRKMRVVIKRAAPYIRFKGMLDWEKLLSFIPALEYLNDSSSFSLLYVLLFD